MIIKGLEILSAEEVDKEKRCGFFDGPCFRSYTYYSDKSSNNSLTAVILL